MSFKCPSIQTEKIKLCHKQPATGFAVSILLVIFAVSGCGSSTSNSAKSAQVSDSVQSTTTNSAANSDSASAAKLGKIVCDATATRMASDAEKFTQESWQCKHKGESLRIDIYSSSEQQAKANQAVLDYYKGMNDNRALSELPLICGNNWAIGIDLNETRDGLIVLLNQNGLTSSTCK